MTLADDILYALGNKYTVDNWRDIAFIQYSSSDDYTEEDLAKVFEMLDRWWAARQDYGPWLQDGDHWDHVHPDGIKFHHESKGCPELI